MNEERFIELLAARLAGEITEAKLNELAQLLEAHPELAETEKIINLYWSQHDNIHSVDTELSLLKVMKEIGETAAMDRETAMPKTIHFGGWMKIAAVFILFIGGAYALYQISRKPSLPALTSMETRHDIEKRTAKGVKSTIELPDGSKIWLNADSKFSYPASFNNHTREVYLDGEAFFDVHKNPQMPFIIHLSNGTVRVLGTSFNIRAYYNENKIETSVATGRVAFIPRNRNGAEKDTIYLTPEKKLIYNYSTEEVNTTNTSSKEDKAWTDGTLIFKAMRMEDIAVELERNFGKKITFHSDSLKDFRMTGSFNGNTLEEILFYLSRSKAFNYEITNDEVLLGAKN